MSILGKLTITPLKQRAKLSPAEHRRSNLIAKLTEQMELAKAQAEGKPLDHILVNPHPARNRLTMLMPHWSGMRVGEIAALCIGDVRNSDGTVKAEIRLDATQTKGKHARTVFVNDRLRKEIAVYLRLIVITEPTKPLFHTQKRSAFSANTLCQTLNTIYRSAGIAGATSHSGRRSFITTLASKGIGVRVLASLAGHKSIATTQAYIDVNDEMKRAAVELVA